MRAESPRQRIQGSVDEDHAPLDWGTRAICRWLAYSILWVLSGSICLLSDMHPVLKVIGIMLSVMLALALPLSSATLFEEAHLRRATHDMPYVICPWLGAVVVLLGCLALVEAASLVLWSFSNASVETAKEFCSSYAGVPVDELPRTVCIQNAFVKTGWEAGKLRCKEILGRMSCQPSFIAAPIYTTSEEAARGLPDNIWAWAVMHSRHVNANYELDGSFCGYLASHAQTRFFLGSYRTAVAEVLREEKLALTGSDKGACSAVPLRLRPLVMTSDIASDVDRKRALLVLGGILLCFCPCVGPLPLAALMVFFHRVRIHEKEEQELALVRHDYSLG